MAKYTYFISGSLSEKYLVHLEDMRIEKLIILDRGTRYQDITIRGGLNILDNQEFLGVNLADPAEALNLDGVSRVTNIIRSWSGEVVVKG